MLRVFLCLVSFIAISITSSAGTDFRSLTESDVKELARQFNLTLPSCPQKSLDITEVLNKTSESIDKDKFKSDFKDVLGQAHVDVNSGAEIKVVMNIGSHVVEGAKGSFETKYSLNSEFRKGDAVVCKTNVELVKSSNVK